MASYNGGVATRVRSFSKINLGLAVGPVRADGFHGLTTCYQTLALYDWLTVEAVPSGATRITLETDHPGVPCSAKGNAERNTAYRIVELMLHRLKQNADVRLRIEKRLPVQGGLGAGSANAVAALLGLERELGVALPGPERLRIAAEVGSDVPLFLLGGTVLGVDRGQEVYPLPESPVLPVVVAVPEQGVSTGQAFRDLDAQMAAGLSHLVAQGLTPADPSHRLDQLSHVLASVWTHTGAGRETTGIPPNSSDQPAGAGEADIAKASLHSQRGDLAENPLLTLVHTGVENDFEEVAFRQLPSLRDIKRELTGPPGALQALYAALSGSGSALFGIYGSPETAREAQQRVEVHGTRAFLTETLPRHGYWQQMFA